MLSGSLYFAGALSRYGSLARFGALRWYGSLGVLGAVAVNGSLSGVGALMQIGSLGVHGALTAYGSLMADGALRRHGSLGVRGALFDYGSLQRSGALVRHGSLTALGALAWYGSLVDRYGGHQAPASSVRLSVGSWPPAVASGSGAPLLAGIVCATARTSCASKSHVPVDPGSFLPASRPCSAQRTTVRGERRRIWLAASAVIRSVMVGDSSSYDELPSMTT